MTTNIISQMAVTLGAGIQDGELFAAVAKNNAMAVGGTSMDVGVVGWATGGGHGSLTAQYSQGADNIIQAVLVTPTGEVITANECQNADIFWAIRGGGGSTFGVIVNITMKAYPMPSVHMMGLTITAKSLTTAKQWYKFVADVHRLIPTAQDQGMSGYWTMGGDPSLSICLAFFLYNKSNTTALAVQRPFVDLMRASNTTVTYDISRIYASSWYQLFSSLPTPESSGTRKSITASRFITRDSVLNKSEAFAKTLEEVGPRAPGTLNRTPNFSMSGTMTASRKPVNNALNPAWRDTVVHVISSRSWNDAIDPAKADALVCNMTYVPLNALWELEPASGCYFNEANAIEPDWQWSLFGPNYGLLRQIKGKYDPDGMLYEDWVQTRDGRLCKAYNPLESGR
ncbi:uncharacterized protein B0T15DRAFT_387233 [Chaetomium strumarium]|uniref:FAD-binding PCMH-type domain-containing protein n=1 Tax=Chaetomium strumarium TaxID=1170767 RepID=A0AAJ0H1H1_9PEZI|nr:hypothetical protein B0T15DRAFT_387233 [Chaetomium strumarium]